MNIMLCSAVDSSNLQAKSACPRANFHSLTYLCLASHKRDICKQYRYRSDATKCGIRSGSILFVLNTGFSIKHANNCNN